jgi:arsenate reductase
MTEGILNTIQNKQYIAYSAGTTPTTVNPYAITVMNEIGIDISSHQSKSNDEFKDETFDIVVTVCDHAKTVCPFFPGAKTTIHHSFPDPSELKGTEEEILSGTRRIRDQITKWIEQQLLKNNH